MKALRNATLAAALAVAAPLASASGLIEVINESDTLVQPYFKSTCWGWAIAPGTTGWVSFGNIGPSGGRFAWDFTDPALTDANCAHPVIEFTYGVNGVPPPDPQKGNRQAAVQFSPDTNATFQVGKSLYSKELAGPGDLGR